MALFEKAPVHPRLLVLLSAILFSIAAPVTKFVEMPILSIMFFRSLIGFFALIVLTPRGHVKELVRIGWMDVLCGVTYATLSFCFFLALRNTTAANAIILFQTSPVFLIPLGYLLLGEKSDIWDILTISMMITGIVLCFRGSISTKGHIGDLIALAGALSFSFMNILMRKNDLTGNIRSLLIGNIIIILVTLPFQFGRNFTPGGVALVSMLGVVQMALPFVIYSRALVSLRALEASIFKNLETVLAPLWVALLVGEIPGFWTVAGFICILCALVLRARMHSKYDIKTIGEIS